MKKDFWATWQPGFEFFDAIHSAVRRAFRNVADDKDVAEGVSDIAEKAFQAELRSTFAGFVKGGWLEIDGKSVRWLPQADGWNNDDGARNEPVIRLTPKQLDEALYGSSEAVIAEWQAAIDRAAKRAKRLKLYHLNEPLDMPP